MAALTANSWQLHEKVGICLTEASLKISALFGRGEKLRCNGFFLKEEWFFSLFLTKNLMRYFFVLTRKFVF